MLKVFNSCCNNCLFSKERIVSPERAKEITKDCIDNQTFFICHKASIDDEEIVCHTFYKKLGFVSQMIRIAERLNAITFVDQKDTEKLAPFYTYNKKTKK